MSDIQTFFETIYGPKQDDHYILLWEKLDRKLSYWFRSLRNAAECAAVHNINIYSGVNLSPDDYGSNQRCKITQIAAQVALIADLDVAGPAHMSATLPPTIEAARFILPPELKPTMLIHSGHGLQAWWCFKEPTVFETQEERDAGGDLARLWHEVMERRAAAKGWKLDAVYDLARVLRVPGTINRKDGVPDAEARILEISGDRYNPSDIREFLDYIKPEPDTPQKRARRMVPPAVGSFVYNPEAKANPVIFEALWNASIPFRTTWRKLRPEMAGKSPSEWDMALANILYNAQLSDQDAVDFLVHFRRIHGGREHNNPTDYLERTLARARDRDYRQPTPESTDALVGDIPAGKAEEFIDEKPSRKAEPKAATAEPPAEPLPFDKKECLDLLNEIIKVTVNGQLLPIKEILWLRGAEARWRIEMADRQIVTLTHASHYMELSLLRYAFAGQLNASLGIPNKKGDWARSGVPLFQASLREVSAGEGDNVKGDTRELLERYLRGQMILPSPLACWEKLDNVYSPVAHNGRIAVHAGGMVEHFLRRGERLNKGDVINGLSALGAEPGKMNGPRGKSQYRYYLPEEWKPEECIAEALRERKGEAPPKEEEGPQ